MYIAVTNNNHSRPGTLLFGTLSKTKPEARRIACLDGNCVLVGYHCVSSEVSILEKDVAFRLLGDVISRRTSDRWTDQ